MIPPRIAANMRKRSIKEGTYGSFVPHVGGWDPAWDKQNKIYFLRPFKGQKVEKNRPERYLSCAPSIQSIPSLPLRSFHLPRLTISFFVLCGFAQSKGCGRGDGSHAREDPKNAQRLGG